MPKNNLQVIPVTKIEDFFELAVDWKQLLLNAPANTLFLTWEWLYTWWQIYGANKQLFILTLRRGGQLVGIAPLYIEKKRVFGVVKAKTIRFLGTGIVASDYLNFIFILTNGHEYDLLYEIFRVLTQRKNEWDIILLEDVPAQSTTPEILRRLTKVFDLSLTQLGSRICPYISIPHSWDDYLNSLTQNRRKKIRQGIRKLECLFSPIFSIVQDQDDVQMAVNALTKFHKEKFRNSGAVSSFSFSRFVEFHRKVARKLLKQGHLYMSLLSIHHKVVAVNYAFKYHNKVFDYNAGYHKDYRKYGVGNLLWAMSLKGAMQDGIEEWDFTRGDASYKEHWTDKKRENITLLIGKRNAFDKSFQFQRNIVRLTSAALRKRLPSAFYGLLAKRVKKRRFS